MSFSVEELSKLETLLKNLHLPPDEASELQAGVMNRLMDVYHTLTLQAGQVTSGGRGVAVDRTVTVGVTWTPAAHLLCRQAGRQAGPSLLVGAPSGVCLLLCRVLDCVHTLHGVCGAATPIAAAAAAAVTTGPHRPAGAGFPCGSATWCCQQRCC